MHFWQCLGLWKHTPDHMTVHHETYRITSQTRCYSPWASCLVYASPAPSSTHLSTASQRPKPSASIRSAPRCAGHVKRTGRSSLCVACASNPYRQSETPAASQQVCDTPAAWTSDLHAGWSQELRTGRRCGSPTQCGESGSLRTEF